MYKRQLCPPSSLLDEDTRQGRTQNTTRSKEVHYSVRYSSDSNRSGRAVVLRNREAMAWTYDRYIEGEAFPYVPEHLFSVARKRDIGGGRGGVSCCTVQHLLMASHFCSTKDYSLGCFRVLSYKLSGWLRRQVYCNSFTICLVEIHEKCVPYSGGEG